MENNLQINILTENSTPNSKAFNYPIMKNKKLLLNMGISIFVLNTPYHKRIFNCDILWINSKVFRGWWGNKRKELFDLLEKYRKKINRVIYFDTTDSSGTLQHELLPFVDKYCKFYLLKDRKLYLNKLYGGRIYTDYYHKKYGVNDDQLIPDELGAIPNEEHLKKLHTCWNQVLSFYPYSFIPFYLPIKKRIFTPKMKRNNFVTCRMNTSYPRNTICFQRKNIISVLNEMGISTTKINNYKYLKEMRKSKIGVSAFGAGEFAWRDFELIINGCMLLKPNMDHIETWPNIYLTNETYESFTWDVSDLKMKIQYLTNHPEIIKEYAGNAQNKFVEYRDSNESRHNFCAIIKKIVG